MNSQLLITLLQMLSNTTVITSMIFMAVGLSVALLAKRITKAVRKTSDIQDSDKLYIVLKALGLVFMMVGLFLMIVSLALE